MASSADAPSQRRLEYLTLLLRQILLKHGLDRGDKLKSVVDFVESQPSTKAACRTAEEAASVLAQRALEFSVRFNTPVEDATVIASYFSVPRSVMPVEQMDDITASLMRLPDTAVEGTEVVHLPGFLDAKEVQHVFDAAVALSGSPLPTAAGSEADAYPHHVRYGSAHSALFLHRDGHFASYCPELSEKVQVAMRSQPQMYLSSAVQLSIRCAEFHTSVQSARVEPSRKATIEQTP